MKLPLIFATLGLAACAQQSDAVSAVNLLGWSDVVVDDRSDVLSFGCGDDDTTKFDVHGKDAAGRPAKASVCCGALFKGCTVRTVR